VEGHRSGSAARALARLGGLLYLIIIVGGVFGELFIRNQVIVPGDALATAANLRSMETLWRIGIASEYFMLVCSTVLTLILYILLRPVDRDLALLAVFFNIMSISMEATNELHLLRALFPLGSEGYLRAFDSSQLAALTRLSLRTYGHGFGADLLYFGCTCFVLGVLIYRSRYIPRALGVMMLVAGLSYVTNTFALFLNPGFANQLYPAILLPPFVGETALCLWLLIKGVNLEKWNGRQGEPMARERAEVI
jgi:hypothetical protein